jgi:hypothetical protein
MFEPFIFASSMCRNCKKYSSQHIDNYCPNEIKIKVEIKKPIPPCNCKDNFGKPLHPGQLHEPECLLRI